MDEIRVGDELLVYVQDLTAVAESLQEAIEKARAACAVLANPDNYTGKATDEMLLFFSSLTAHIERLQLLYMKAAQYVTNTYKSAYYNEEQLIKFVLSTMGVSAE